MKILSCKVGLAPEIIEVSNIVEAQRAVLGKVRSVEASRLGQDFVFYMDADCLKKKLPFNRVLFGRTIHGNFCIAKLTKEKPYLMGLDDVEAKAWKDIIHPPTRIILPKVQLN